MLRVSVLSSTQFEELPDSSGCGDTSLAELLADGAIKFSICVHGPKDGGPPARQNDDLVCLGRPVSSNGCFSADMMMMMIMMASTGETKGFISKPDITRIRNIVGKKYSEENTTEDFCMRHKLFWPTDLACSPGVSGWLGVPSRCPSRRQSSMPIVIPARSR